MAGNRFDLSLTGRDLDPGANFRIVHMIEEHD
jgi:hypothetical protein